MERYKGSYLNGQIAFLLFVNIFLVFTLFKEYSSNTVFAIATLLITDIFLFLSTRKNLYYFEVFDEKLVIKNMIDYNFKRVIFFDEIQEVKYENPSFVGNLIVIIGSSERNISKYRCNSLSKRIAIDFVEFINAKLK